MVRRRQRERSLFEVLLPDGHKLWPDWLRRIDTLLEDEAVIEVVAQALETRWPQSRRRGRPGTPAEVVIRMLILKHLFDWSYDDLEHEVRANLVYRAFTRIDADEVPDAKTILKIARALGPEIIEQLHRSIAITRSSDGRRSWRPVIAALRRPRTRPLRTPAASDASSCRRPAGKHRLVAHMNGSDGSDGANAGALDAKDESVCSNGDMDFDAVVTAAPTG
jgi:hypothetical protein